MSQSQEIQFKRKEIVRIFVMLIGVSLIVFGLGIFIGRESPKKKVSQEMFYSTQEVGAINQIIGGVTSWYAEGIGIVKQEINMGVEAEGVKTGLFPKVTILLKKYTIK